MKLLTRDEFRILGFERDAYKCVICGEKAVLNSDGIPTNLSFHHILERRLFDDGGYYLDNGATLCEEHHLTAEMTTLSVEEVRSAAGITNVVLPEHLYNDNDFTYDKWGNIILQNGKRVKGELFFDESVQKILMRGGVLDEFTDHVKYPRTYHLPWSEKPNKDDKVLRDVEQFEGREVVATIKMDGECLAASTSVTMADGTKRRIIDLVKKNAVGELVLGYDHEGRIIPTPIEKVYNNGSAQETEWYRVRTEGKNRKVKDLYCTSGELFFVNDNYIPVTKLNVGDKVSYHKRCLDLTMQQREVMLGALLGDASFHVHKYQTALLQMSHKEAHLPYIKWLMGMFGYYATGHPLPMTAGYGTQVIKTWTKCTRAIYDEFIFLFKNGKKAIPKEIVGKLSPLSIAVWYMDDGSLLHNQSQRDRATLATCGFDKESCENLQQALSLSGLTSTLGFYKGYYQINLDTDSSECLFAMIQRFIPPIMRYKLPVHYRNLEPTFQKENAAEMFFNYTIDSEILAVDNVAHRVERTKYDLQTGTGNFFANDVLVHNCTTMYSDYIHARSLDSNNHPSRNWVKGLWGQMGYLIPAGWRVCGENLYAVHTVEYANLSSYFQVFSIWNEKNECLSWDETIEWCELLGLTHVPVLYKGEFDEKRIRSAFDDYKRNEDPKAEGYVVRLADEFSYGQFRKSIAKMVCNDFEIKHGHWQRAVLRPNGLKTS